MNALIQQHVPLHDKNWFKTGGPARYYCTPHDAESFKNALSFANGNQLPLFILGHGANILISDAGFPGLVIQPQLTSMTIIDRASDYVLVKMESGVSIGAAIEFCLAHQLLGLEEFSGIPGTIGGAIYINLHYFEFLIAQFLVSAEVIEQATGNIEMVDPTWFAFGYNQSKLHLKTHFLLHATFKLKVASQLETAFAQGRSKEIIRHRAQRYPKNNTCGSFFRNFHEHEVSLVQQNKKMIYVAYYLDKIGVKGALSYGDAIVSYQHANMIVNRGNATSSDICTLARMMQEKVYDQFGIVPRQECILVGFDSFPLLSAEQK